MQVQHQADPVPPDGQGADGDGGALLKGHVRVATGGTAESLLVRVKNVNMRRLAAMSGDEDFFISDETGEFYLTPQSPCTRPPTSLHKHL